MLRNGLSTCPDILTDQEELHMYPWCDLICFSTIYCCCFCHSCKISTAQRKTSSCWQKWQRVKFKFWWSLLKIFQVFLHVCRSCKFMVAFLRHETTGQKHYTRHLVCCVCHIDWYYTSGRLPVSESRRSDRSAEGLGCGSHVPALGPGFQQKDAKRTQWSFRGQDTQERWVDWRRTFTPKISVSALCWISNVSSLFIYALCSPSLLRPCVTSTRIYILIQNFIYTSFSYFYIIIL